jgi:3-oxoacyl-[acyl-carrier-protein] synthase III
VKTLIESLGVYLPPRAVSTDEVLRGCAGAIRFPLEKFTGIRSRRVAGDGDFAVDLAEKAARDCLRRSAYAPGEIDLVVSCSISRCDGPGFEFTFEPCTAIRLARRLGLARARAFDISSACTGMFTGILVADTLIKRGAARAALIVSGEHITPLTVTAQKEIREFLDPRLACLTLGDAGAALVLAPSPSDAVGFHDIEMFTLGRYAPYCVARATPIGPVMFTDSVKITEISVLPAAQRAVEVLERNRPAFASVDHVILHQTSRTTLRDAARVIEQLFPGAGAGTSTIDNLAERGNTASTTHFVALADFIANGAIEAGDNVVFGISGSGQTLGTALYTLDDLPARMRNGRASSPPEPGARPPLDGAPSEGTPGVRIGAVGTVPDGWAGPRTSIELGRVAAEDCLGRWGRDRADVGLLVHAGVYRTDFQLEPAVAATLAGALGLNDSFDGGLDRTSLAFDVFNGGVGLVDACWIAAEMIRAGRVEAALVTACEVENNGEGPADRMRGVAQTGSALLLERAPAAGGFGRFHSRAFTEHLDALHARISKGTGGVLATTRDLRLEELYLDAIPGVVAECLALEGIPLSDVDLVIAPQISSGFVARLAGALGVDPGRCVDATVHGADLFTSSIPHALRAAAEAGRGNPGEVALAIAVGSGIQVACAVYRF